MYKNKQIKIGIITIITLLLVIQITSANPTIQYTKPANNGELIDEYPQEITVTAYDNIPITNCTITTNSKTSNYEANTISVDLTQKNKLGEGNYTTTTKCTNINGETTTTTKNFKINTATTIAARNEKNFQYTIWLLITIITLITYLTINKKERIIKAIAAGAVLVTTASLTTITQEPIILIPITMAALLLTYEIIR